MDKPDDSERMQFEASLGDDDEGFASCSNSDSFAARRRVLWSSLYLASGFLPTIGYFFALLLFVPDARHGTGAELLGAVAVLVAFVLVTPLFLAFWSKVLIVEQREILGSLSALGRIGVALLVVIGMTLANYVMVFAGCNTVMPAIYGERF